MKRISYPLLIYTFFSSSTVFLNLLENYWLLIFMMHPVVLFKKELHFFLYLFKFTKTDKLRKIKVKDIEYC